MTPYRDTDLFIAGAWVPARTGKRIPVIDPASEETIGSLAHAGIADLDRALEAALAGFAVWKRMSPLDRCGIMRKAAGLMRERADAIALTMTLEQGKPLAQSKGEILASAGIIEWFAEEGRRAYGQIVPARSPEVSQQVIKLPIGPVAAFTPWNFPISQIVRKLGAALASGCSIIVKAPEETPASPAAMVEAFADAGLPAGVIGLVFGDPAEISSYLIAHPAIEKVSFTGSTPVGKQLAALAGLHMKRATMELGGHAPALVFDDADLARATSVLSAAKFRNAGQVCVAPTRFLVQSGVHERFLEAFAGAAGQLRVAPGLEPGSDMGPLANARRIPALEALIADALERGARLVQGGKRIGNKGYFFEPTILADVPISARIMNEEPFGPVAIVNRFDDDDEAIAEANRLRFGLASYAFTTSLARAHRLGTEIAAGMTTINHNGLALPELPFGGIRDSGYGTEGGSTAMASYQIEKLVTQAVTP